MCSQKLPSAAFYLAQSALYVIILIVQLWDRLPSRPVRASSIDLQASTDAAYSWHTSDFDDTHLTSHANSARGLLVFDLFEYLLRMRAYLNETAGLDDGLHLLPVLAVLEHSLQKQTVLLGSPATAVEVGLLASELVG
jgi:hypothetical protein